MKAQKRSKVKILAAALSSAVIAVYGCGGGGGGGGSTGGGTQPTQVTSPQQAASSAVSATSTVSMVSTLGSNLSSISNTSFTATSLRKSKKMGTSGVAKLDPRMQQVVDRMKTQLQAPVVKNAASKARAAVIAKVPGPVNQTIQCDNYNPTNGTGTITVTGQDTSTNTYSETSLTLTFNSCRDNVLFFEYTGTLQMQEKSMIDLSSYTATVTGTNFTLKQYTDANFTTLQYADVLNATFTDSGVSTATSDSGTFSANGSFTLTIYDAVNGNTVMTYAMNSMKADWSETYTDSSKYTPTDEVSKLNGGMSFSVSINNSNTFGLSISATNFEDKWHYLNDTASTEQEWLNGRIQISWTPTIGGCYEGIYDFVTDTATPLTYTLANSWSCPVSGTLKVNNATIVFGSPIVVTVGSTSATYASCSELEAVGASCSGQAM